METKVKGTPDSESPPRFGLAHCAGRAAAAASNCPGDEHTWDLLGADSSASGWVVFKVGGIGVVVVTK